MVHFFQIFSSNWNLYVYKSGQNPAKIWVYTLQHSNLNSHENNSVTINRAHLFTGFISWALKSNLALKE